VSLLKADQPFLRAGKQRLPQNFNKNGELDLNRDHHKKTWLRMSSVSFGVSLTFGWYPRLSFVQLDSRARD